jgi:hypothetical protein
MRSRRSSRRYNDDTPLVPKGGDIVFTTPRATRITRSTSPGNLPKGVLDQGYGALFEVSALINNTDLTLLYDQYCIEWVEYVFELTTPFLAGIPYPRIVIAADYTDAGIPATENVVLQYGGVKVHQFTPDNTKLSVKLKPRPAMAAFASGVSTGYAIPSGDVWFDTANTSVDHYGLKFWVADYNSTISTAPNVRTFAIYHLKMRATN